MTTGMQSPQPSGDDRGPENTPSSTPDSSGRARKRLVVEPADPMANAHIFINAEHEAGGRELLVYHSGVFRRWDGTAWPMLREEVLRAQVARFFEYAVYVVQTSDGKKEERFKPNKNKVGEIVEALKHQLIKENLEIPSWFNPRMSIPPEEILPVANGLLWIPHRVLLSPTPEFFNAYALPYDYEEGAARPDRWLKFQDEVFGDDEKAKRLLQEWFGYLLTVDTSQHKILLEIGPMRSGKGTTGRVCAALLGAHNVAGWNMRDLCDPHGLQELVDKPAVFISDARMPKGSDTNTAVERLLSISGEDPQSVNPKFKERHTVKLPSRITIMTNELPKLVDSSGALVSRLLVLRFRNSFLDREDPDLLNELLDELPGILLWALEGRDRLNERRHFIQPESGQALLNDLMAMASPISSFIDECCVVGPDERVEIDKLYRTWVDWCRDNGHIPGSKSGFLGKLRAVVQDLDVVRGSGTPRKREYVGIGLA